MYKKSETLSRHQRDNNQMLTTVRTTGISTVKFAVVRTVNDSHKLKQPIT